MANKISDETIEYVGILAKLELNDQEKEEAKKDMGRMLDYIDMLNQNKIMKRRHTGFLRRLQWIISMPSIRWLGFTGGAGGWSKMIYGRFLYI